MKYNILKNHFNNFHYFYRHKSIEFFENEERKAREDDPTFKIISISDSLKFERISFEIAYMIAKQKTPHTIAESLIKPCIIKVCEILFDEKDVSKIECIPLSNSIISRRISDISDHLLAKTIFEIKSSQNKLFFIQLDETTDVSSCAQLMVYVRYKYENKLKEEFLFFSPLQTATKSKDIPELVTIFFEGVGLLWENVCGFCTDGAPAMLGSKSGFQTLVKKLSPQIKDIHCMIHRYALVCKAIQSELNYIRFPGISSHFLTFKSGTKLFSDFSFFTPLNMRRPARSQRNGEQIIDGDFIYEKSTDGETPLHGDVFLKFVQLFLKHQSTIWTT